jgi:hypothetical protein
MLKVSKATSYDYERPRVNPLDINRPLLRIKLNTPLPQILLACYESFVATTKFYKHVFSIDPLSLETYFNFY